MGTLSEKIKGTNSTCKSPTCHRRTLPQSCACIRWNWPSHSRGNADRSVHRGKREEKKIEKENEEGNLTT